MDKLNRHEQEQKNGSFSLIERVILSAGAMLIFSVSFQIDQMPEGEDKQNILIYIDNKSALNCWGNVKHD
jgi:hypothetical protein